MTKKVLGVSCGQQITQSDIERMANEAERGYGDAQLRRTGRGRPSLGDGPARAVQVRLDPQLHAALEQRAKADHKTPSEIVREALHEYLRMLA
jgi:predicted HicB family RNase H-like nuclease